MNLSQADGIARYAGGENATPDFQGVMLQPSRQFGVLENSFIKHTLE